MARNSFNVSEEKSTFLSPRLFFEILKITKDRNKKYYYATPSSFVIHGGLLRVFKRKHTNCKIKIKPPKKKKDRGKIM